MGPASFENLLKAAIGLDANSIGVTAIERAVRERQAACDLADRGEYSQYVQSSPSELQALIEAVVVPETWFFRDPEAFTALAVLVRDTILPRRPDGVARILSLPCATGEEPYSMAMALFDAAIPAGMFRIDGVDVSHDALAAARHGEYRKSSFRGAAQTWRSRYFTPSGAASRISDRVRQQVTFHHGNLLSGESLPGRATYDVIFCRNLLIYFDRRTQERAIAMLVELLAPQGLLFVGAAEAGVPLNSGLASARTPGAHVFRRQDGPLPTARRAPAPVKRRSVQSAAPQRPRAVVVDVRAEAPADRGLEPALELANQGRFVEAKAHCDQHLKQHGPSAEVFYLLGLISDAVGDPAGAVACYRKALYLDPHHHETLVHLALLMEAQDSHEAHLLRTRVRRLSERGGTP